MEEKIKILSKTNMFCPVCEEEHEVELIEKEKEVIIKGEKIKYKEKFYRCNKYEDENTFQTGNLWNEGLIISIDIYREKKGLLTSKEIKKIRRKYEITQLEMAQLLGLGDITITRYETKQIQDEAHDKIMRLIDENALITLEYLEKNKSNFKNEERFENIKNNIKRIIFNETINYLNEQEIEAKYIDFNYENIQNGNQILDINKIENIINYISKNYSNLYKVKLMKLLWYIDCIYYKENNKSLTGLVYVHQKMGALPIAYDELLKLPSIIVNEEIIENSDYFICYHILPNENYRVKKLSDKEKRICDLVINKFKNFSTKEIVDYMHKEKAYIDTKNNEIIDFSYAKYIDLK